MEASEVVLAEVVVSVVLPVVLSVSGEALSPSFWASIFKFPPSMISLCSTEMPCLADVMFKFTSLMLQMTLAPTLIAFFF